jgi:Peroxiredoxin
MLGLLVALVIIAGVIGVLEKKKVRPVVSNLPTITLGVSNSTSTASSSDRIAVKEKTFDRAKEIVAPSGFVNTDDKPITLSQYVGKKVILLDIMTYSCVNCIRTFPYLIDWYKKYEDKGLVIIGIHTPEFEFEKVQSNVEAAMKKYGIEFPVVLDNDYGTWSAYKNLYWPRKYLIDIDGFIRYDHIGEGGYAETEEHIRELLEERATVLGEKIDLDMPLVEDGAAPVAFGQTPETYLGAARNEYFGNGTPGKVGAQEFALPQKLNEGAYYLSGQWNITSEYAESGRQGDKIVYPIKAKKAYLVMSADKPTLVDVSIDGTKVKTITVKDSQLYELYAGKAFGAHELSLSVSGSGLRAYAFTFGN